MRFFQTISEVNKESVKAILDNISMREEDVCYKLWGTVVGGTGKELDVHMAAKLLIFCMFKEVDKEEGHILADNVLVALIRHLLTDRTEADKIENLFLNINKWYS